MGIFDEQIRECEERFRLKERKLMAVNLLFVVALAVIFTVAMACLNTAVSDGAEYRTDNFVVTSEFAVHAEVAAKSCEFYRGKISMALFDKETPRWASPCLVTLTTKSSGGAGGSTAFAIDDRGVASQFTGTWESMPGGLLSMIRHEVAHTVMASHYGSYVPRWLDEGVACIFEGSSERDAYRTGIYGSAKKNIIFQTEQLVRMKDYPDSIMLFYNQSHSLVEFLIEKEGFGIVKQLLQGQRSLRVDRRLHDDWLAWTRGGQQRKHETFCGPIHRLFHWTAPRCVNGKCVPGAWQYSPPLTPVETPPVPASGGPTTGDHRTDVDEEDPGGEPGNGVGLPERPRVFQWGNPIPAMLSLAAYAAVAASGVGIPVAAGWGGWKFARWGYRAVSVVGAVRRRKRARNTEVVYENAEDVMPEVSKPLVIRKSKNHYVRVEETDGLGEAFLTTIREFTEVNPQLAEFLKSLEESAQLRLHSMKVDERLSESNDASPVVIPNQE